MNLQKAGRLILFIAFFLCLHFFLRFWAISAGMISTLCNYGGPFGVILPGWLFVPALLGVTVFLGVQWWRGNSFSSEWPWLLIFSGGLGNLLERFFFGCIMDYIALPFFPVFNSADVSLTVGVVGILLKSIIKERNLKFKITNSK